MRTPDGDIGWNRRLALCSIAGLLLLAMSSALIPFAKRRKQHPLRERHPILSLGAAVLVMLKVVSCALYSSIRGMSFITDFDSMVLSGTIGTIYLLRAFLLYWRHNIAHSQRVLKEGRRTRQKESSQSFANDKLIKNLTEMTVDVENGETALIQHLKFLSAWQSQAFILALSTSVLMSMLLIGRLFSPLVAKLISAVFMGLCALLLGFVALKIRECPDEAIFVQLELGYVARISCLYLVFWILLLLLQPKLIRVTLFPLFPLYTLVCCALVFYYSILMPTLRAKQIERSLAGNSGRGKAGTCDVDLNFVLSQPYYCSVFREFLESEFSQENLLFYQDVEEFRSEFGCFDDNPGFPLKEKLRFSCAAMQIYSTYIANDSPIQVNLPSRISFPLRTKFEKLKAVTESTRKRKTFDLKSFNVQLNMMTGSIFDEAQTEIFNLMKSDSFPRFLHWKFWQSVYSA